MDGETKRGGDVAEVPGLAFVPFLVMEDLLDKLKLLDYERHFCKAQNMKPLSRHYFATASHPADQFYYFTSLTAWLLSLLGRPFERPQEYTDPNATVANILAEMRAIGLTADFPPAKLKQGYGEYVVQVLDRLADMVLRHQNFKWHKPKHVGADDDDDDDAVADEDDVGNDIAEVTTEHGEVDDVVDEALGDGDVDDDGDDDTGGIDLLALNDLSDGGFVATSRPEEALQSKQDAAEWRLEVERVLPLLKVHVRADDKDWRVHLERMSQHRAEIETQLADTKQQLGRLHEEIARALEKMASREKYINAQLSDSLSEYRKLRNQATEATSRYDSASVGVTTLSKQLAAVTDELDLVKARMDEHGTSMTDAAPLVRLKQALTKLRSDTTDVEMRTGVLEHILLTARMRDKSALQRDMNAIAPTITSQYGEYNTI